MNVSKSGERFKKRREQTKSFLGFMWLATNHVVLGLWTESNACFFVLFAASICSSASFSFSCILLSGSQKYNLTGQLAPGRPAPGIRPDAAPNRSFSSIAPSNPHPRNWRERTLVPSACPLCRSPGRVHYSAGPQRASSAGPRRAPRRSPLGFDSPWVTEKERARTRVCVTIPWRPLHRTWSCTLHSLTRMQDRRSKARRH